MTMFSSAPLQSIAIWPRLSVAPSSDLWLPSACSTKALRQWSPIVWRGARSASARPTTSTPWRNSHSATWEMSLPVAYSVSPQPAGRPLATFALPCSQCACSFPRSGLSAEEAELSRTISRTTRATTEAARDSSPTAPADDVSSVGVGSLNYATCNGRLSQNSLFSAGSSALGRSSSRGSLGSMGRRSGDTDTPPAGPHAFESHETLVKCPAPKRARVSATSSFHSISPRKFAFD